MQKRVQTKNVIIFCWIFRGFRVQVKALNRIHIAIARNYVIFAR